MAHNANYSSRTATLILLALALTGCGSGLATLTGKVTLDGTPLDQGNVTFHSQGQPLATAQIQPDGSYQAMTGAEAGIAPGTYKVAVSAYEIGEAPAPGEEPLPILKTPAKYSSAETSGLEATVSKGSNEYNIPLVKDGS